MNRPSRQAELPLSSETVYDAMPEEVIAECRQLIGQMLREVIRADKEVGDEQ